MINISNMRECFFDNTLVNNAKTTAQFLLHHPEEKEIVMVHDAPWEGDCCGYHNFIEDDGLIRMYYLGNDSARKDVVVCYAESRDGITWVKPSLNICEFNGSTDNNIIVDSSMVYNSPLDNFMVFKDDNPDCSPEQRYKAVAALRKDGQLGLRTMYSADGIHFVNGRVLTTAGEFDTLNVVFWDEDANIYRCYFRGFHVEGSTEMANWNDEYIRDVRYMESPDFVNWTESKLLRFEDDEDYPLYTNMVQKYIRAGHILIGFPTRYWNRRKWSKNYDELCGKENRRNRMTNDEDRSGIVMTDCIFMTSRDGLHFKKYNEAFMRPGAENERNWIYGDCYPARGLLETPSDTKGADNELSMYSHIDYRTDEPASKLMRYTIRCDGFVSMHAGEKEKMLVTKKFTFEGSELYVNFSTSALGYMYFTLVDADGNRYESCETFGDRIDRRIPFEDGVVEKLSGKPVTLEVRMRDADLYSIMFR